MPDESVINVMIVDDDQKSRQVLEYHLSSIPGILIMAVAPAEIVSLNPLLSGIKQTGMGNGRYLNPRHLQ